MVVAVEIYLSVVPLVFRLPLGRIQVQHFSGVFPSRFSPCSTISVRIFFEVSLVFSKRASRVFFCHWRGSGQFQLSSQRVIGGGENTQVQKIHCFGVFEWSFAPFSVNFRQE